MNEQNAAAEAKIRALVNMHITQAALTAWVEAHTEWDEDDFPEALLAEHAALDKAAGAAWDVAHNIDEITLQDRILASVGRHPLVLIRLAQMAKEEAQRALSAAIRAAEDEDALRNEGLQITSREVMQAVRISKSPLN